MTINEFSYKSADNVHDICAYTCVPDGEVRAILQIVHGVAEHFWRYNGLCEYLTERGILVCGHDQLGHGKTAKDIEKGFFAEKHGWDYTCADVVKLTEIIRREHPGKKHVIFGHSMGSFVTRTVFMKNQIDTDGIILSGTGHTGGLIIKSGRFLAKRIYKSLNSKYDSSKIITNLAFGPYIKAFGKPRTPFDWISGDEKEVDEYIHDNLCGFDVSVSLFMDMLNGLDFIRKKSNYKAAPRDKQVLFISGKSDPVGKMGKGVLKVFNAMQKAGINAKIKFYEGRHEVLHEPVKHQVMEDIYQFILTI